MADDVTEPSATSASGEDPAPAKAATKPSGDDRPSGGTAGHPSSPPPASSEDARGRWTIRSTKITPELLTAVRKAAERAGMKQGDWIADRLFQAAIEDLKRETLPGPTHDETAKALAEIRARLEEQKPDPRLDEIADGLRNLNEKIDRPTRSDSRIGAMMEYMVELRSEIQQARQEAGEQRGGLLSRLFGKG